MTKGVAETWRELVSLVKDQDRTALEVFEKELAERDLHPHFRSAIDAQIEIARGDGQKAWKRLWALASERELGPHERLMRGLLFMEQGRLDEALEDLKAAKKAKLWDPRVEGGIASIAIERGHDEPAERFLGEALGKAPGQWTERLKLCIVQRRLGKWRQALTSAEAVTQASPDFEIGWLLRAAILVDLGRASDALDLALPIAQSKADWFRLRVAIVDILRAAGRYDEAIGTLAPLAVKLGDPHLLMDLIELYLLVGQPHVADAMFDLVEAIKVDSARLSFLKGSVAETKGPEYREEAMIHYEVALEQDPTFWRGLDALGSILSAEGELKDLVRARRLYEDAAASPERPVRPLLNLTLCWADEGRFEDAISKVEEILRQPTLRFEDKDHAKKVLVLLREAQRAKA